MTEQSVPPTSGAGTNTIDDVASSTPYQPEPSAVTTSGVSQSVDKAAKTPSIFSIFGAEFLGTFILVFLGVGAAVFGDVLGLGQLGVAFAFAIGLIAAISAVGHISGGAFNPAVSLGLALAQRISFKELAIHWPAQLAGGAFATFVLWAAAPRSYNVVEGVQSLSRSDLFQGAANGFGTHTPGFDGTAAKQLTAYLEQGYSEDIIRQAIDAGQLTFPPSTEISLVGALIIEAIAVAIFVGVILAVTDKRSKITFQPVVIGLLLGGLLIVTIPLTNGSLNPARSFAAAIFAGGWAWSQLWVFIVAPLIGAAIAALFYRGFAFGALETNSATNIADNGEFFTDAFEDSVSDSIFGSQDGDTSQSGTQTEDASSAPFAAPDAGAADAASTPSTLLDDAPAQAVADAGDELEDTVVADAETAEAGVQSQEGSESDAVVQDATDGEDDEPEGDTVLR